MNEYLADLKNSIAKFNPPDLVNDFEYAQIVKNVRVALMAGGESSRFKEVSSGNVNKSAFLLPNGDTMIEMAIRMYRDSGIINFVVLAYHNSQSIIDILGDGSKLGVNIKYSFDPEKPVGKGGAVKNALLSKSILDHETLIVHNPDDVIVNFSNDFPKYILSGHIQGLKANRIATVVVVPETTYPYTGMQVLDNCVETIEMYPMIPIPTHIGVTIFDPKCYYMFNDVFDLNVKTDFESVLFPILSKNKSLHAVSIPFNNWIPVNNLKSYKQLLNTLNISY